MNSNDRIAFLHIGKTAGTSFTSFLQTLYPKEKIYNGSLQEYLNFDDSKVLDYDLYLGHSGFNLLENKSADIITFLRNPIDRLLSLYFFWQKISNKHPPSKHFHLANELDIVSFFDLGFGNSKDNIGIRLAIANDTQNTQAWQLASNHTTKNRTHYRKLKLTDDELFKMAITNLDKMAFVGLTELFDDSIEHFCKKYPQYSVLKNNIPKKNITADRKKTEDVPMSIRRELMRFCEVDYAVYDYALRYRFLK